MAPVAIGTASESAPAIRLQTSMRVRSPCPPRRPNESSSRTPTPPREAAAGRTGSPWDADRQPAPASAWCGNHRRGRSPGSRGALGSPPPARRAQPGMPPSARRRDVASPGQRHGAHPNAGGPRDRPHVVGAILPAPVRRGGDGVSVNSPNSWQAASTASSELTLGSCSLLPMEPNSFMASARACSSCRRRATSRAADTALRCSARPTRPVSTASVSHRTAATRSGLTECSRVHEGTGGGRPGSQEPFAAHRQHHRDRHLDGTDEEAG